MHLSINNIALPPGEHAGWWPRLAALGLEGVEICADAAWGEAMPSAQAIEHYVRPVRQAGLTISGLHVELAAAGPGWFDADPGALLARLGNLSALCRDLGGATLSVGGARWRGALSIPAAWRATRSLLQALLPQMEAQGVLLCLMPLPPGDADFCNLAMDCRILADALEHPALGLAISARALLETGEIGRHAVFASHYGRLELFVADDPGWQPFGDDTRVDHAALRRHLSAGGYHGWVCLRQRHDAQRLADSLTAFVNRYRRPDNLSLSRHLAATQSLC